MITFSQARRIGRHSCRARQLCPLIVRAVVALGEPLQLQEARTARLLLPLERLEVGKHIDVEELALDAPWHVIEMPANDLSDVRPRRRVDLLADDAGIRPIVDDA